MPDAASLDPPGPTPGQHHHGRAPGGLMCALLGRCGWARGHHRQQVQGRRGLGAAGPAQALPPPEHRPCCLGASTASLDPPSRGLHGVVPVSPQNRWRLLVFSSVAQSCPTLCDPMNHSMPGLPVHHQLPELAQTHVYQVGDDPAISSSVVPFSFCLQSFPALGSLPMSQFFTSGSPTIGVSASASVLPVNIQA